MRSETKHTEMGASRQTRPEFATGECRPYSLSVPSVSSSELYERVRDIRRSFGFTLVELMVVLAVIAVLIMILLPTLQSARARARSAACQNNLRQYGIAMGRYMSDWKGYFIYPGNQVGGATYKAKPGSYDPSVYKELSGHIVNDGSYAHDWYNDFVAVYLSDAVTLESLSGGKPSVRVCPSVLQELRAGNYFDPKSSNFKGTRETDYYGELRTYADFESSYDDNTNLVLVSYFTTYAINQYSGVYRCDRTNISANTIAFIDWNAKEGWGADITCTNWFDTPVGRTPAHSHEPKCAASNIWWLTEVGFYHKDGTNAFANYVAMDGHVGSVSSNQINRSYFESTGPK